MSNNKYNKSEYLRIILENGETVSKDIESAKAYLESEGLNSEHIASEGLKRIRKIQLQADARRTEIEMNQMESFKRKAIDWVEELLKDASFSFHDFVKTEKLSLQNRNLENLSREDIKNTLIQYYTLKLSKEDKKEE